MGKGRWMKDAGTIRFFFGENDTAVSTQIINQIKSRGIRVKQKKSHKNWKK